MEYMVLNWPRTYSPDGQRYTSEISSEVTQQT